MSLTNNYILGSHNSLSYLPIKHWYQRVTALWARCQSKTLKEQYDSGVRLFDIRIRFDKHNNIVFCHNKTIFKYDTMDLFKDFSSFEDTCYVRFILDIRKKPKNSELLKQKFLDFVRSFSYLNNVIISHAIVFWEWDNYFGCKIDIIETNITKYNFLPPKWHAKLVNEQLNKFPLFGDSNDGCILMNYV